MADIEHRITSKLGEILVEHRIITAEQLEYALDLQKDIGSPLGQILVNAGLVSEGLILTVLASMFGVGAWHLHTDPPSPEALAALPDEFCRQNWVIPVQKRGDLLLVGMRNPNNFEVIEEMGRITGLRIEPLLVLDDRLAAALEFHKADEKSHRPQMLDSLVEEAMREYGDRLELRGGAFRTDISEADTRPVVGLVNQLLGDSIRMRASDIHIEPREHVVEVRFRLDGQLKKIREFPVGLLPMVVARIKIMAELDIVEHRMPQDGRISVQTNGRQIDVRVSVLPNIHGQRIVMRILDKSVALKALDEIGFDGPNLQMFRALIRKPYGMMLVTGPTGSGKTTTLYAALQEVRDVARNIMTTEDPVEYAIEGINQSQTHEKVGLTFATQLRAILRQDPDVVLVGEIRDQETAETAVRAALTGHMVMSTLHANNAPAAVPRLIDMGVDPMLLSSALIGVMSQRLVRRLCPSCKLAAVAEGSDAEFMAAYLGDSESSVVFRAAGCDDCFGTGYRGRVAIHEILPVSGEVSRLIARSAPVEEIVEAGCEFGYRSMQYDALRRVATGETSMEEARKVVFFDDLVPRHTTTIDLPRKAA